MASSSARVRAGVLTALVLGGIAALLWWSFASGSESYSRSVDEIVASGKPGQSVKVVGRCLWVSRAKVGVELAMTAEAVPAETTPAETTPTASLVAQLVSADAYLKGAADTTVILSGRLASPTRIEGVEDVIAHAGGPSKYGSGEDLVTRLARATGESGPGRAVVAFMDAVSTGNADAITSLTGTDTTPEELARVREMLLGGRESMVTRSVHLMEPVGDTELRTFFWPVVELEDGSLRAVSVVVSRADDGTWAVVQHHSRGPVTDFERALIEAGRGSSSE